MESFDSKSLDKVRKDIESVLEVAAEQLGISLTLGGFRYSAGEFKAKITGIAQGENGEIVAPYEKAFNDMKRMAFDKDKLRNIGDEFSAQGDTFSIIGWKPRATKYPLLAKNISNGKIYKFGKRHLYTPGNEPTHLF